MANQSDILKQHLFSSLGLPWQDALPESRMGGHWRLHIAQQPLSRQIRDLEAELEVQLFYRTKRTVRLTEVGQAFLTEARKTLQQADRAVAIAQQVSRGEAGNFAVGFTGPALNSVLPGVVRQFKQQYPQITLRLERLQTPEQVHALREHHIQAGFLHPPIETDVLHLEPLHREGLVVALPDSHCLAQLPNRLISLGELANEAFILFPRPVGPVLYDRIIHLCQEVGFSPRIVQEVVPQQTILGLVAADIGIALLHASAQSVAPAGVVFRELIEPTPELELAIAWHPDTTNPVLPAFLEIARAPA